VFVKTKDQLNDPPVLEDGLWRWILQTAASSHCDC